MTDIEHHKKKFNNWYPVLGVHERERRLLVKNEDKICIEPLRDYMVIPLRHDVICFKSDREDYHYDFRRFVQMEFSETIELN